MTTSLSRDELVHWARESVAFHGLELARISSVLLAQAYALQIRRILSVFDLTQPIKVLEGVIAADTTPSEDRFRHPPLTGLYKKHFTSPRFMTKNLLNYATSKEGRKNFSKVFDEASRIDGTGSVDDIFLKYLAHHTVVTPLHQKTASRTMTGEWVVFHKHEELNFYLTFAAHDEANAEIHKRVTLACEFDNLPFRL
jgi:hypothetical protein